MALFFRNTKEKYHYDLFDVLKSFYVYETFRIANFEDMNKKLQKLSSNISL